MYLDNFKSDHITCSYCYLRRCFGIVTLLSILIFKIATLFFLHTHVLHVKTFEIYQKLLTNNITPRDLHSISFLVSIKDKNVICPYRTMSFLEYYRKSTWDIGHELDATFFLQKTDHFYLLQG